MRKFLQGLLKDWAALLFGYGERPVPVHAQVLALVLTVALVLVCWFW